MLFGFVGQLPTEFEKASMGDGFRQMGVFQEACDVQILDDDSLGSFGFHDQRGQLVKRVFPLVGDVQMKALNGFSGFGFVVRFGFLTRVVPLISFDAFFKTIGVRCVKPGIAF